MTSTGGISIATSALRGMVADSPSFRAWVGVLGTAPELTLHGQALDRVHLETIGVAPNREQTWTPELLDTIRPYALVGISQARPYELTLQGGASGGGPTFADAGSLYLNLVATIHPNEIGQPETAFTSFANTVSAILDDVAALSGSATPTAEGVGRLDLRRIVVDFIGPGHPDLVPTDGHFMSADCSVSWGVGGGL